MSGILYPILILTLFLIVQILTMMASRKAVLDKNKQQLLDSVNASNKIYTNEELSILVSDLEGQLEHLKDDKKTGQKYFWFKKDVTKESANPTDLIISNIESLTLVEIKMFGSYGWINYGGFVDYTLGGLLENVTIYGMGESVIKKGELGNSIGTMEATYQNKTLTIHIPFTRVSSTPGRGSIVIFEVLIHGNPNYLQNITAVLN